jgi:acyl-CoA synthetase (AMP-forming)/AMP-acid ligase II
MQITQSLHRNLQHDPQRPMTVYQGRVRSVAESADRIARLAGALHDLGVRCDDRVAMLSLNSDRYHEFYYAAPWAGAIAVPVNTRWSPTEIAYSLQETDTRVLLVDDTYTATVPALQERWADLATIVHCGDMPTPAGMLGYEELLAAADPVADTDRGDDDVWAIFYTGGTTGHPKGVMLTHRNFLTMDVGSLATYHWVTLGGRMLHAAPMFHGADMIGWVAANLCGSTQVIVPSFEPVSVLAAIAEHRVTEGVLIPTMIQMMVDHPHCARYDLSSLKHVIYGGSPISLALIERMSKTFPSAQFLQTYGMTETAAIVTMQTPAEHYDPACNGTAGRSAVHCSIKIVDPDDNEVPRGTVGEIVARGDNVMLGYWKKPGETAAVVRDGWMHTGDGGYMNDDGYIFVVDRIKDMIITGGENVYSTEVENALAKHPAVATSAVIGLLDEKWGERVHAVVVLQAGATAEPGELTEFCRAHIANYKVPRSVTFVDVLPTTPAGKVLKRELRQQLREGTQNPVTTSSHREFPPAPTKQLIHEDVGKLWLTK